MDWQKRGKGLTASTFVPEKNVIVKHSITQQAHGWQMTAKVFNSEYEYKELRVKKFFVFEGGQKALNKAKAAALEVFDTIL